MFIFKRVTTPLYDELVREGLTRVQNMGDMGSSPSCKFLLQNLGDKDVVITVGNSGISIPEMTNQNQAAYQLPNGDVRTKLARFSKPSTMLLSTDLSADDVDIGVVYPPFIPTDNCSLELDGNDNLSSLTIRIVGNPDPGLIPLFFVDQDYQLDRLSEIVPDGTTDILTSGNNVYNLNHVNDSIYNIVNQPGSRVLVLYINIDKVDGEYVITHPDQLPDDHRIFLNPTGNLIIHWGGVNAMAPVAEYLPSNTVTYELLLDAPSPINCAGALNYGGVIEIDQLAGSKTYTATDNGTLITDDEQFVSVLTSVHDLDVTEVSKWQAPR